MSLRRINLMLETIKRQNKYDYKIEKDKERIKNNIKKYRDNLNQNRIIKTERKNENVKKNNKILKTENYITKNPIESIEFNNRALIPIEKDNVYNYINNYNFDRYKVLYNNERNRLKISKSVNFKLSNYSINKRLYMDNIKNIFYAKNLENQKKTKQIFEDFKKSNFDLRNRMNLERAKKYDNFMNYISNKEYQNEIYNEKLNNKRLLAKDKYDEYLHKKDNLILKRIRDIRLGRIENAISNSYNNINTINNKIKDKLSINKEKKNKANIKKLYEENIIKLNEEKENNIREILDNENKHFFKAKSKIAMINDYRNKSLLNSVNNNKNIENILKEAQILYERNYKNEVIYKKGNF